MKRSKTLVLNYILSNVGILLPIYACDLIYAIFFFEYKKPQVQYIRLNDIIFQEFYNCGIICRLYAIFSGGSTGTTEGGKITNETI